ncbi:toprim domain-containing protein [Papillibacter cinnamivorans]|uniref:Ribonuclease M5 n=1 Tax=Papillibacter cinnamivorans DSM 12816 TaxID=1122930 RepID=A0A1W1ZGW9_9FIRM|nr:DUF4093 domain-containing protein [Papillibacter cinnamivorans]SMC47785.1 ribonuclease M5 [Papillibacter cinnamivorans DSM 12816]
MIRVSEVIVVEGRYDKNTLRQLVDATIIETSGFGIFSDEEKLGLLRKLAQSRGIIVLTDSDGAGFVIRNYLKGALPADRVKHAYIPDISGKERRKRRAGREGKLGVEGMESGVLLRALKAAGATFGEAPPREERGREITRADLYADGFSGGRMSGEKRRELLLRLDLPEHLNTKGLTEVLNALMSYEEYKKAVSELGEELSPTEGEL